MSKRAKVIKLLLEDGSLNGIVNIAEEEWIGEFFSASRDNAKELMKNEACSRWGIYLLLSKTCVYIGQSKNLQQRIGQHLLGKDWWETVAILTTKDDTFNKSDIDYLENILIEKAKELNTLDVDNIKKGNPAKVDKFRSVTLDQYLEESLFLLEFIGVEVFSDKKRNKNIQKIVPSNSEKNIELRAKSEVVKYVVSYGVNLNKFLSYAKYQENKQAFWANPKVDFLNEGFSLVLNNQIKNKIYVMNIPGNTMKCAYPREEGKLITRKDKKHYLDLLIDGETFIDKSGVSFKEYIVKTIEY